MRREEEAEWTEAESAVRRPAFGVEVRVTLFAAIVRRGAGPGQRGNAAGLPLMRCEEVSYCLFRRVYSSVAVMRCLIWAMVRSLATQASKLA